VSHEFRRVKWQKFQPLTTVVVPVLNEHANVLPLVKRVRDAVAGRPVEILFVDDSKNELTVEAAMLARIIYRSHEFDVRVYHRLGNKNWGGLSGAVTDGMAQAKANQIIVMDGDLQHPPETIPAMIAAGHHNDIVVASRYRKGGSASGLDGGIRHLVSRGSTVLAKTMFPWRLRKVSDPMTGFFLMNRTKIDRSRMRPKGFKILLEVLATHPELRVAEVPLKFAERTAGESHGTLKQGLEFFSQLAGLRLGETIRPFTKLPKFVQFGAIGGSVFALGMALLYGMVEILHVSPLFANAVQLIVTFWLNYVLNKKITWRERSINRTAAHKFLVSRGATTAINYFLFAWLISLHYAFTFYGQTFSFGINYLVANIITLIAVMALNYEISDRWAFAEPKEKGSRRERIAARQAKAANRPSIAKTIAALLLAIAAFSLGLAPATALSAILATAGIALFLQASVEVWRMMYSFRNPEAVEQLRFPQPQGAQEKFLIIVPARHESAVLASTLRQLSKQSHPNTHIVSVLCDDDFDTIRVANEVAATDPRISVMQYPLLPGVKPSKPKQLNYVLEQVKNDGYTAVGIVDAEDTVHPELLMRVDAAFRDPEVGIVQGGVQLMNHDTSWFSLHNVLEYYRWFNSAMAFQSDVGFFPLGGNTIFVRHDLLQQTSGWPETLTEDCSLGVLVSSRFRHASIKTAVYYEPELATREETPDTLTALFMQRVRWNQGFFHEWRKGIWQELPSFRIRLLAGYVLLGPVLLAAISVFMLASIVAAIFLNAPVGLVLLMYLPLIPVALLSVINAVFLHDFGKAFGRKVSLKHYLILLITQPIYQIVLNAAAFWSVVRELRGDQSWYKTSHAGLHRGAELAQPQAAFAIVPTAVTIGVENA
jgi:cellulose synthase/poly-beta-1,6-N-acetylglucosamine synthase-like glycosyltransferase